MSPRARAQDRVACRFKVGVMQDASYWERSNSELLVLVRTCSHRTPMLTLACTARCVSHAPGMVSKIVSRGARESAQPTIAVCGAWPCATSSLRITELVRLASGRPSTKRLLPSCRQWCGCHQKTGSVSKQSALRRLRASLGPRGGSAAVRTGRTSGLLHIVRAPVSCEKKDMAKTSHLQHTWQT